MAKLSFTSVFCLQLEPCVPLSWYHNVFLTYQCILDVSMANTVTYIVIFFHRQHR